MTLDINKGIICDLLQCKCVTQVEGAVLRKMNEENGLVRVRLQDMAEELDDANAKILILQQINMQLK